MLNLTCDCLFLVVRMFLYVFFSGMFHLYRSEHSFQCVKWFLLSFVGCAHWRAACSAAGCQGLNRVASDVRFIETFLKLEIICKNSFLQTQRRPDSAHFP